MSITFDIHSFNHEIKEIFLSEPVFPLPDVYISYKLYYNGKVVDIQTSYKLNIPERIINWEAFKEEIRKAAEKDSKKYLRPGWGAGRSVEKYNADPLEAHYLEQRNSYKK